MRQTARRKAWDGAAAVHVADNGGNRPGGGSPELRAVLRAVRRRNDRRDHASLPSGPIRFGEQRRRPLRVGRCVNYRAARREEQEKKEEGGDLKPE
jgi:hypothetical protein